MSVCYIFPGQGSQTVGMGRELYDNNPRARAVFDEVDAALDNYESEFASRVTRHASRSLSDIIFNGSMDELTLTRNVQPAIFAVSAAILAASENDRFDFVAGHSLGEYSALYAANAIGLADVARILRLRGDAMQAAVPVGVGMVAVVLGLEMDAVTDICMVAGCEVANDNSPGQVVISGYANAVTVAMQMARDRGAKRAMPLPLSAPVHCSLQEPAAVALKDALRKVEIFAPSVPMISNQTAAPMTDPSEIRESLVYQMTHGVRWRESVLNMPPLGVTETVEVGPGNVLSGLVTRIAPELAVKKLEI